MGSELNVRVTEQELEYRSKNYRDIRAIEQRQLNCCSCGNVLSPESGRVFSHPIFGILQCENCKNHFKTVTFSLEKDDSVRVCHICGRERKNTYGCKKRDCPYEYCKNCIKRTIPKSLVDAESEKWKCFACNTQPLWKLRGACAAVMNSLPKRTKTKKVKSRNRSSESEDETSDLRKVSYVKRTRLEATEKLKKRLLSVCDDESPTQADEPLSRPQLQVIRSRRHENPDHISAATKRANVSSSSDDSDLEEIKITKPKTVVKSQSERRVSNNARAASTHGKSRSSHKTNARSVVIALSSDSSSDDASDVGKKTKDCRKSKSHVEKRNEKASRGASVHGKGSASGETMPSSRKTKNAKKIERKKEASSDDEVSADSDDDSSDDSGTKAIKDLMPSLFAKDKSREKKKSVVPRSHRRDSSSEEPKTSRDKSKARAKSKSSNVSSKSAKNAKPRDAEEATDDDDDDDDDDDGKARKKAKKPLNRSPGPKSFKEATMARMEKLSTVNEEDSDHSVTKRSARDKQKRKIDEKSVGRRQPASGDSSSGKEFKEKKLQRPRSVRLRSLCELDEDLTTPAIEVPEDDETDIMTKDQAYGLKNSIDNFYKELKAAATKLLNDVEEARKSYYAKKEIRVDDANRMVLETKNVARRFREIVDKSDTRVTDDYDRWCVKTRVKNVLRHSTRDANRSSRRASEIVEEAAVSESPSKSNASDKSQSTLANGAKNVAVSECDSSDIFSADESRRSTNHSNRRDSEAAGKNDQVENAEASRASDASLFSDASPDETTSKNVAADSSEKAASKIRIESPTMSEFSGRSDNEVIAEDKEKSHEKITAAVSEFEPEPMDTSSDPFNKENSAGESEKEEEEAEEESRAERKKSSRSSPKIRRNEKIHSSETAASDGELEGSKESGYLDLPDESTEDPEPRVSDSEKNEDAQNDVSIVGNSPEIAKVDKNRGIATIPDSDDESEASAKAQDVDREKVADSEHEGSKVQNRKSKSNSPKSSQKSKRVSKSSESTKDKEISAVDSETELPKAECKKSDEVPAKVRKTRKSVTAANGSDGEGNEGPKRVSSSKAASRRPSEDSAEEVSVAAATDEKSNEETSKSARKADSKSRKKNSSLRAKSSPENDATTMDEPPEVEGCDVASASTLVLSREESPDVKDDNGEGASGVADAEEKAESAKDPSSPKPAKKIDAARLSDAGRRSSSETMLLENSSGRGNSPPPCETDSSMEIVTESQNKKAKLALLESSNSDDSTSDEREFPPRDRTDAPLTPPESDTKSETNLANDTSSTVERTESNEKTRRKRSKLRLTENRYYMADPKLKRKCVVRVERLKENALRRYSHALRKSNEYVETKNLKRLVSLDKLDKNNKKVSADTSDDEDESSSKDLKPVKSKSRAAKEKEETLLDHLNKLDNGETVASNSESDADSSARDNREKAGNKGEEDILAKANEMAKKRLLESSDSNAEEEEAAEEEQPAPDTKDAKTKKVKQAAKKEKLEKSSDNDEKNEEESDKNRWRKDKILTSKISDSDSDLELKKFNTSQDKMKEQKKKGSQSDSDEEPVVKKQKKKRVRRRVLHSDSDAVISEKSDSDSESSVESIKKKKKKKGEDSEEDKDKKKTRKRTRKGRKGSSDSSGSDERPKPTRRKRIKRVAGSDSDSDDDPDSQGSPGKAGRKNIRKVIRDKQVADDTKQAAKAEEERLKRIAERQKLYNEMYENRLAGEEKVDKLVLDFDEETKEPLVSVDEGLVKRLKPHQAKGIKFMWDACFESLERAKSTKGSGCILAHCMGLGKTFQVVTLSHTLLTNEETGVRTILVVCPLSTVLNWANEFKIWLEGLDNGDDIEVYEMTKMKKNFERKFQLARWQETGGVMIIGYEMFRNLTQPGKKVRKNIQETFLRCLVDPGPDLIVCDEGHLLKKEDTALSKAMRRIKTLRRVVLTGTPLQNNLIEYHCMVQFVKPNLLGTKKEFMNRFENPITNGQFDDSTEYDVKLMKKRAHILHKLLEGSVQRFDYSVLTPFLPPKQEYVIFVRLTKIQIDMYRHYLDNYARRQRAAGGSLFADFQALQRIWTHPMVMQMNAEKVERANEKKRLDASDTEGSLKDFIDDDSDTPCSSSNSDVDGSSDEKDKKTTKRSTRANPVVEEPAAAADDDVAEVTEDATNNETQWWTQYVKEDDYEDIRCSSKLLILFRIIKESEQIGDKLLVFSQSLYSLTLIETFLKLIDDETQRGEELESLDGHTGSWSLGLDYFRLDGQTSADNRRRWCDIFNRPTNTRARLFLISTRAGGLGINLTAANRVVIFDASWNPSHDVQSIFRIYRFGQKKPCYVYRLLAAGTMEEKIYNRQVTKLSLSCRVVDEQQIERHYSNNALAELYQLELPSDDDKTLNLPKDRLLAEIFSKYRNRVENYHEHDSLLENQAGEELDEEERKQAWVEYEEEKKGKRTMPPMAFNYQDPMMMQQINMMNMGVQNAMNNPAMLADYQKLQRLMEKDYPGLPEAQQKLLASRAVYEMYNYVEQQAMSSHGAMNLANLANMNISGLQNIGGIQGGYNNQMPQSVNPAQAFMDVMRMQQQQTMAQQQNGQIKFANNQQQLRNDILRQQQQLYAQAHNQKPYAQKPMPHLQAQSTSSLTPITIDDDDIMEVLATDQNIAPPAAAVDANPKNKEE